MSRNKYILLLFMILNAFMNLLSAAEKSYIVSFVADSQALGLVNVKQKESGIQVERRSITPMQSTLGSTAVVGSFYNGWDGDIYYDVVVITGGNPQQALDVDRFAFGSRGYVYHTHKLSQKPGQYHPLHTFHTDTVPSILSAGTFGTSGANNYITYRLSRRPTERIFVNPESRSPGSAAISPDGMFVSQMTYNGLNHIGVVGRLINGKLSGTPLQWLNANAFRGYSQSLSNQVNGNHRYLAYRNFRQPGTSKSESQVIIQNVDATTGKPQGSPRVITKLASAMNVESEKLQSIAISPDGKLILYTAWSDKCQKQILFVRRLENGSSIGSPMIVCDCKQLEDYPLGVYGINIAQAPSLSN